MSAPNSIKIDSVEYVRADSVKPFGGDIKIVVMDRGFVYVGETKVEGDWVLMTRAKNIRKWGTSRGLGELTKGPLGGTVLDSVGSLKAPMRALIHIINVDSEKWTASL
jgi:hypothetical protein